MSILCCFLRVYFDVSKRVKTTSPIDILLFNAVLMHTTRKTGINVEKFGINVAIYGTKMRSFFGTFYDYNMIF